MKNVERVGVSCWCPDQEGGKERLSRSVELGHFGKHCILKVLSSHASTCPHHLLRVRFVAFLSVFLSQGVMTSQMTSRRVRDPQVWRSPSLHISD